MTGPFQSEKGSIDVNQGNMDEEYIDFVRNNSGFKVVVNDMKILFKTIITVIKAKGI